ncbi:hypothetical protein IGB42_03772 [Andreprevotia sp. IGB-42]|uniref:chemotaxis protein CheW n=1 Tax=Andreprevotia sp. IGB-42 TaxID=2497473 RepID=UPI001358C705|nr:chemotaxis protein CheW [Andreprevotia sp. IGB-42]KAF0811755.1 hypothetical protein IGB42_03772 [Andreprevotia sp. IGB-42]
MSTALAPAPVGAEPSAIDSGYLVCRVADTQYVFALHGIDAITRPGQVVPMPLAPAAVLGLVNHRSRVCPVLALSVLCGHAASPPSAINRVLMLGNPARLGLLVDEVLVQHATRPDGVTEPDIAALLDAHCRHLLGSWQRQPVQETASATRPEQAAEAAQRGQPFITFAIGDEEYGLPLASLQQATLMPDQLQPADTAGWLGLATLPAGQVAVLDVGAQWQRAAGTATQRFLLVLALQAGRLIGLPVDRLHDMVLLDDSAIQPVPPVLAARHALQDLAGIWHDAARERTVALLDLGGIDTAGLASPTAADGDQPAPSANEEPTMQATPDFEALLIQVDAQSMLLPLAAVVTLLRVPADFGAVPQLPAQVAGILHWRGKTVGVVDLRKVLALPAATPGIGQRIVLLTLDGVLHGLLVDRVDGIEPVYPGERSSAPALSAEQESIIPYVVQKADGRLLAELDPAGLYARIAPARETGAADGANDE